MPYKRSVGADHPGLFVFLLDCSGSMAASWPGDSASGSMIKAEFVANVFNKTVREFGAMSLNKRRCDIAVVGYDSTAGATSLWEGKLRGHEAVSIVDIVNNPLGTFERDEQKADPEAGVIVVKRKIDFWLKPTTGGSTPMGTGLAKARSIVELWLSNPAHTNSFPPVIIHVTDGKPDNTEKQMALDEAEKLKQLATADGNVLVFTVHLPDGNGQTVLFPSSENDLPAGDDSAKLLYTMSSVLPDEMVGNALEAGLPVTSGCRLMVLNADAMAAAKMIQFGSTGTGNQKPA